VVAHNNPINPTSTRFALFAGLLGYDSPRQVKYTDPCSLISEPFLFTFKLSELTHRMKQVISSVIMLIFVDYQPIG